MSTITLQELFNKMWTGLSGQGWEKASQNGSCEYLTVDGRKCAVGHCLTDPGSAPFGSVCDVLTSHAKARKDLGFPEDRSKYYPADQADTRLQFLRDSQNAHDCSSTPEQMQRELRQVGKSYGLTVPGEVSE